MNIKEYIYEKTKLLEESNIQDARMKVRIVLTFVLKQSKEYLMANNEETIARENIKMLDKYIENILQGIPIQYITNNQEFMKLNFYVDENVLIPQPDTEILVEKVLKIATEKKNVKILDLCTGSGCIGISLAKYIENVQVVCSDISFKALQIAKLNAEKNNVHTKMRFIESDLFSNISEQFDMIVSNPPYIKKDIIRTLDKEVKKEPIIALDGGTDGLDFYKKIIKKANKYLNTDGYLCLEIGYDQKEDVERLIRKEKKYRDIESIKDFGENDRVIIAKKV